MTIDSFRKIALGMPDSEERSHMEQPDFRVRNKIFATLPHNPEAAPSRSTKRQAPAPSSRPAPRACVKLTPEQQRTFIASHPAAFSPAPGAWGAKGFTMISLPKVDRATAKLAVLLAWRNTAPARMVIELSPPLPPPRKANRSAGRAGPQ